MDAIFRYLFYWSPRITSVFGLAYEETPEKAYARVLESMEDYYYDTRAFYLELNCGTMPPDIYVEEVFISGEDDE